MMTSRYDKPPHVVFFVLMAILLFSALGNTAEGTDRDTMDIPYKPTEMLRRHLEILTVAIGERSVYRPENIEKTRDYIVSVYKDINIPVHTEPYSYRDYTVSNVVAEIDVGEHPKKRFLLGAHYDSVAGTVGADDNASAVAVQLETARQLSSIIQKEALNIRVTFVSFALEEPPVYATRYMGSRVYAKQAKKDRERIDGMICLEMVGYTCDTPGCQAYPFPLKYFGYPEAGDFIGVVGNIASRSLTGSLLEAFEKNTELPVVKLTVPFNGWILPSVRLSDHASFWDQGYRAVMITDSAFFRNPNYHLTSDTMDTLDFEFMAELVESLILFFRAQGTGQ